MKFPAATSTVFFFDVGRANNCSFHTFPVMANLRLDTAPWDNSTDHWAPRWQTTNRDAVRLRSAASRLGCNADAGHRFLPEGGNGSERSVEICSCVRLVVTFASFVRGVNNFGFTRSELRTLWALKTPAGIQRFLDELPYNLSYTARSPQKVLRDRTASCLEGGIFGAAALRVLGFPPLIFDLEADQDTDHVVAIFKVRGHWGAVAKSNFTGCRYREPVYRSLRELAMSYFNVYFNLRWERTLRRYSRPVNLARFDRLHWMSSEKPIWFIAEHLCEIPHISLLTPAMEKRLTRLDPRTIRGEMVGHRKR